ncbi:spheroidene monooxygenase [Fertoeibacter niger]|uniref:spheroidene monooxygenase n=1 Tax=Fertoeibacter niger TaxID=2656921 RepID=UPI0030B9FCD9
MQQGDAAIQTVTLSLFRFDTALARLWVLGQMATARLALRRMQGAGFWKLCGSGTGEGFTPKPNWGVWAILVVWPDEATARRQLNDAALFRRWRAKSTEGWTVFLAPQSARGLWAGVQPFTATDAACAATPGLAVLTRASLRPAKLARFWARVPGISAVIGADPHVAFKIGIGELPLLHQITFSLWPDAACMARFARGDGPHGRAIKAVRAEGWFREELYARFHILGATGTWAGADPLLLLKKDAA